MKAITANKLTKIIIGLFLYALGIDFNIRASLGLSPWSVFHQGLGNILHITIGQATIISAIIIVILDYFLGQKIGIGTVLNMIFIGLFVDLILWMDIIPVSTSLPMSIFMILIGMITIATATCVYISAGLGSGPRDGLMIALTKMTGWKTGYIRMMIEATALVLGFIMGGQVGLGSAIIVLGQGPILQLILKISNFDLRNIKHVYLLE